MKFLDRESEFSRLDALLTSPEAGLGVIYGRRRVGKTRLLLEWCRAHDGVYWVADESAPRIQRRFFALALARRFEGFADVDYPDWDSLLSRLSREAVAARWRGPLVIDELPYLVSASPELPSIVQRWIDHDAPKAGLITIISGSSQRMMQGIALHASAPLFGRAKALFKISPLSPVWLTKAFSGTDETEAVRHFAAWGGMPRYWELAAEHGGTPESQLLDLVLDPQGPLNAEPDRLLHEETPTAVSLRPILDAIGLGAHKLSEIAGRIGMPATSLSPHLSRLIELEMVEREIPFGESEKSSKRSLYIISDPFLRFWFRIVAPNRSALSLGTTSLRLGILRKGFPALLGAAWEQLCRMAMPRLPLRDSGSQPDGGYWIGARRYWRGDGPEWDIVARSADGESLFLGECKWTDGPCSEADIQRWERELLGRGVPPVPEAAGKVSRALFVPVRPRGLKRTKGGTAIIDARELFRYL